MRTVSSLAVLLLFEAVAWIEAWAGECGVGREGPLWGRKVRFQCPSADSRPLPDFLLAPPRCHLAPCLQTPGFPGQGSGAWRKVTGLSLSPPPGPHTLRYFYTVMSPPGGGETSRRVFLSLPPFLSLHNEKLCRIKKKKKQTNPKQSSG